MWINCNFAKKKRHKWVTVFWEYVHRILYYHPRRSLTSTQSSSSNQAVWDVEQKVVNSSLNKVKERSFHMWQKLRRWCKIFVMDFSLVFLCILFSLLKISKFAQMQTSFLSNIGVNILLQLTRWTHEWCINLLLLFH